MIEVTAFGKKATLYCLKNKNGMQVTLTNYGARIVEILLPVEEGGSLRNVSLACSSDLAYLAEDVYVGSTILPVAGRISGAKAEINGQVYSFTENEPARTLHGGIGTANEQYWEVELVEDRQALTFGIVLPDGLNGFPGPVAVQAVYELTEANELKVTYRAKAEQATLFNPTNHVYFNLSGDFRQDVGEHELKIAAQSYVPLGEDNLPLGHFEAVEGTPFDFREFATFNQGFKGSHPQNILVKGYDHPWVLDKVPTAVEVVSPDQKVRLQVETNQPAMVIYTYNFPQESLAAYHGVFSMECQALPNACNLDGFGSILLEKGQNYISETIYRFLW
ncbi:TPA: aldose epimerase family protein [Streptococcus suis]